MVSYDPIAIGSSSFLLVVSSLFSICRISEDHVPGAAVGELFATIMSQQFKSLAFGDPYFYKHDKDMDAMKGIFDISSVTLAQIIKDNTFLANIGSDADGVFYASG